MSVSKSMRFRTGVPSIEQAGRAMESATKETVVKVVPISMIELDPLNRTMSKLDIRDPRNISPDDPNADHKREYLEELEGLAKSIKATNGVQQPIRVYKRGYNYRVIFGERRVLGSVLAGFDSVPAIVVPDAPKNLRSIQLIENLQRQNLLVWEAVKGLQELAKEERGQDREMSSAADLVRVLGYTKQHAHRMLAIMEAPSDVKEKMRSGVVKTVRIAYQLTKIKDPENRKEAIRSLEEFGEIILPATSEPGESAAPVDDKADRKRTKRKGRKRQAINLGKTDNLVLIKHILVALGEKNLVRGTDWESLESVQKAWNTFLKAT